MAEQRRVKAVVFDLDGTLVRLRIDYAGARRRIAMLFARRGVRTRLRPLFPGIEAAVAAVRVREGSAAAARARAEALREVERAEVMGARRLVKVAGMAATVRAAREGRAVAIASNNGRACVRLALRKAGISVAVVRCREDGRQKPHPELVRSALRALRVRAAEAVLVGDAENDVRAARAAGVRCIGVGVRGDVVVRRLAEVPAALERLEARSAGGR